MTVFLPTAVGQDLEFNEAVFAPVDAGYTIKSAFVTGDEDWNRRSLEEESQHLEDLIAGHLLMEPPADAETTGRDPFQQWELTVPTIPKEAFLSKSHQDSASGTGAGGHHG